MAHEVCVNAPERRVSEPAGFADLEPLRRSREQRAWNWYDWANSAYYTTVLSVLFALVIVLLMIRSRRQSALVRL